MKAPDRQSEDGLPLNQLLRWTLLGLAGIFLAVGCIFVLRPDWGALIFGLPVRTAPAASYVRAIGLRDMALAFYIAALVLFSTRRAVALVLGCTTIIPIGDLMIVASWIGITSPWYLGIHGLSAVCFAALTVWTLRPPSTMKELRASVGRENGT